MTMIQLVALLYIAIVCTNDGNDGLHTEQVRIAGYMAILLDQHNEKGVAADQKDQQINAKT